MQQAINYGDIRLIYASELCATAWWLAQFPAVLLRPDRRAAGLDRIADLALSRSRTLRENASRRIDLGLLAYTIGFLALHWLFSFPVWDRYLLILVPIVSLISWPFTPAYRKLYSALYLSFPPSLHHCARYSAV